MQKIEKMNQTKPNHTTLLASPGLPQMWTDPKLLGCRLQLPQSAEGGAHQGMRG